MHRFVVLLTVAALALAGCGSTEADPSAPSTTAPGAAPISGPLATVAVAGDAQGGAVVHAVVIDGRPRTTVRDLATGTDTVVPSDGPLLSPAIWVTPTGIGVVGARCPRWKSAEPPKWNDDSVRNISDLCGTVDYRGWVIDRSTGDARKIELGGLRGANGVGVIGARGDVVLLSTRGFESSTSVLDTRSGETSPVPAPLDTGGSAEAQAVSCLGADGRPFVVMAWTGAAPPSVTGGDWQDGTVTLEDGSFAVVGVPGDDGRWRPIRATGTAPTFDGVKGCGPSGVWAMGWDGGGQIDVDAGVARVSAIAAPPGGKGLDVSMGVLWGGGPPLALQQPVLTSATVDRPRAATAHLWEHGRWQHMRSVDLDPSSIAFRNGAAIAALQERAGSGVYELEVG